jgi:urea transport system permease protein
VRAPTTGTITTAAAHRAHPLPGVRVPRLEPVEPRPSAGDLHPAVARLRRRATVGLLAALFVIVPAMAVTGIVEPYTVNRLGRYLCFAIAAIGVDLIWGYAGVLSLCQALFFCLGGYAVAMHLSLPAGGGDVRPEYNNIPQFFFFNSIESLPVWWQPFASLPFTLLAAIVVPAIVSGVVGFFIFRNRVRGVYFSIITQALAWGAFLAFSRNELLLGGTNGLTNFYKPLNSETAWILGLYLLTAAMLVVTFVGARHLTRSRFGRVLVAVRDNETRLYFLGYRPELYKAAAFVTGAVLAALAGMLYVPQNGIITPNVMRVEDSIWMVIWVALGGRGKLWGAVIGALVASFTYSMLTSDMPSAWPFIQGGLFLAVLAFPDGISQLWTRLEAEVRQGATVGRVFAVFLVVEAFLVADKLGAFPRVLALTELAFIPLKYWILIVLTAVLLVLQKTRAALPIFGVSVLIVSEALGLMPGSLSTLKYVLLVVLFAIYAAGTVDGGVRAIMRRLTWRREGRRA